jgi:hypothetical protein
MHRLNQCITALGTHIPCVPCTDGLLWCAPLLLSHPQAAAEIIHMLLLLLPSQAAAEIHVSELGNFGYAKNWVALAILVLMLVAIGTEKVHRMWCAFVAAFAMMSLLLWCNMTPSLAKVRRAWALWSKGSERSNAHSGRVGCKATKTRPAAKAPHRRRHLPS